MKKKKRDIVQGEEDEVNMTKVQAATERHLDQAQQMH